MSADPLQDSVDVLTVVYNNYNHDNMEIFTAPYLGGQTEMEAAGCEITGDTPRTLWVKGTDRQIIEQPKAQKGNITVQNKIVKYHIELHYIEEAIFLGI